MLMRLYIIIVLGDHRDLPQPWTPYYRSFSSKILFSKPPQNSFFFYTTSLTKSLICEKNALVNSNTIKFKIDIQRMLRADYYTKSIPTYIKIRKFIFWMTKEKWMTCFYLKIFNLESILYTMFCMNTNEDKEYSSYKGISQKIFCVKTSRKRFLRNSWDWMHECCLPSSAFCHGNLDL